MSHAVNMLHQSMPLWLQRATSWTRTALMPTLAAAAVNLSLLIITAGTAFGGYLWLRPPPVKEVRLISVDPDTHVIDRSAGGSMTLVRRVVMRREATLQVIRVWIDANGGVAPTLDDYITLAAGAHERSRVQISPPTALNPGPYRYRVTLRTCDPFCSNYQLEDIEVLVLGEAPTERHPRWQEHRF